jgi:hypothetical protein
VVTENKTKLRIRVVINCNKIFRVPLRVSMASKQIDSSCKSSISPVDPPEVITQVIFPRVWISL